jgi:hypothetical protein
MNRAVETRMHTYAEPLAGLRVSWGAILAGALASIGVALLLWALALAIVLTASSPTAQSFRTDALALWVCAMATTLVGAAVGGALSGFLPGNPLRAIGGVHAFLSWATAFILVTLVSGFALGSMLRTSVMATVRETHDEFAPAPPRPPAARVDAVADTMIDWGAGLAWSWFGTWAVAAGIATAAGVAATRRLSGGTPDDASWQAVQLPAEPSGA